MQTDAVVETDCDVWTRISVGEDCQTYAVPSTVATVSVVTVTPEAAATGAPTAPTRTMAATTNERAERSAVADMSIPVVRIVYTFHSKTYWLVSVYRDNMTLKR
jgi:hypothetical protein